MELKRRKANTIPIKWTDEEISVLKRMLVDNEPISNIYEHFNYRTLASIRSKIRKVRILNDIFGMSYRTDKIKFTSQIAELVNPKSVFDAYAGSGHQTFEWIKVANIVFASELNKSKFDMLVVNILNNGFRKVKTDFIDWELYKKHDKKIYAYQGDAVKAASYVSVFFNCVDLIDLDTCGSTILTLPTYLNLLKPKYLVITHGEYHSYRFGRSDVLRRVLCHNSISDEPNFNIDLSKELDKAVKTICFRSHNETKDSFYPELIKETWLGSKNKGMIRRLYKITRPIATSDILNELADADYTQTL